MKLQHIIIIFVIIIVPISLVLSAYINAHIKTIENQTKYDNILINATYDGVKAFQLNTANNMYSTISNSKIRDIEASISTFYNSLGTELGASGYDKESLQQFIPAIVYTMYDGYYIYGKYYNDNIGDYQYGLRPYVYYSCRYVKGNNDLDKAHQIELSLLKSLTGNTIDGQLIRAEVEHSKVYKLDLEESENDEVEKGRLREEINKIKENQANMTNIKSQP